MGLGAGVGGGGGGGCSHTAFTDNADCHHVCIVRACPATYASVVIIIHNNNTYKHTFSYSIYIY